MAEKIIKQLMEIYENGYWEKISRNNLLDGLYHSERYLYN